MDVTQRLLLRNISLSFKNLTLNYPFAFALHVRILEERKKYCNTLEFHFYSFLGIRTLIWVLVWVRILK